MQHSEHVQLIRSAINSIGGTWAEFGSGEGAFTLALRDLAGMNVEIYSIDQDAGSLTKQQYAIDNKFPGTNIHYLATDFSNNLDLPPLDGILMANSLHYVIDQLSFLKQIRRYLKPNGKLVIVEYNSDNPNPWVPYPLSYPKFIQLAKQAEFRVVTLTGRIASSWMNEMYSAEALR